MDQMETPYSPLNENFESEEPVVDSIDLDQPPFDDNDVASDESSGESSLSEEQKAELEKKSIEFFSSWNKLVSTTNWEKGRIIGQWRESLKTAGAPVGLYSDETWSRQVGNVTPQHVGRLRRVFDRFGETYSQYDALFWSHFQAAVEWDDAEMWLEGAVQDGWSVARMRKQRWEAIGAPADQRPRDEDVIVAELDEDVSSENDSRATETIDGQDDDVRDPEATAFPDSESASDESSSDGEINLEPGESQAAVAEAIRPFEDLPELPHDLSEAVETLKIAILRHKMEGWREVTCDDLLMTLNSLKQMAMAPSEV
jgi:hypothetical protein